jgi:hypothetical protein
MAVTQYWRPQAVLMPWQLKLAIQARSPDEATAR